MSQSETMEPLHLPRKRANAWLKVLLFGMLFYVLAIAVLFFTENPNLFPTTLILGSFKVPAAYVSFFYAGQMPLVTN